MSVTSLVPIPLFVLTGFLGSGKTTLINAILRMPTFADSAVIVNEFGDIGLDHHLIAESVDNVVLMDSGCLCCALNGSLEETLADLYRRRVTGLVKPFHRVIIETSGLADPAPILNVLLGNKLVTDNFQFEALVCTVDATHFAWQCERFGEWPRQVAMADCLVFTKLDIADADARDGARLRSSNLNPGALQFDGGAGRVPVEAFEVRGSARCASLRFAPLARHLAGIKAHGFFLSTPVTWAGIAAWTRLICDSFGDRLIRTKALLQVQDEPGAVFLQGVGPVFHRPERLAQWPDADPRGRIVCIGQDLSPETLVVTLPVLAIEAGIEAHVTLADLATIAWRS